MKRETEKALQMKADQLEAVVDAIEYFLETGNFREVSRRLLKSALRQTKSEYGFIGVVAEGPALRILAHEGVVWDQTVNRKFYENALRTYQEFGFLEFTNLNNLFGHVITSRSVVCSNDPDTDPLAGGLPPGHPPLRAFLGVPILHGGEVIGMFGVANRSGGYVGTEQAQIEILAKATGVLYDSCRRKEREEAMSKANLALLDDIAARRQMEETIKASLKEKEVLLREVYHRVKNNLQVIASLLSLQASSLKDPKAVTMFRESQNRVKAMALVHEKLYQSHDLANVDFNAYIQSLVMSLIRSYGVLADAIAVNTSVENVSLSLDTAVPCGLLINELISNVLKHAFPRLDRSPGRKGELTVRLRPVGQDTFELIVRDNGIGMPPEVDVAHPETFGLKLIATLAKQLRGTLECRRNGGTEMRLVIREADDRKRS